MLLAILLHLSYTVNIGAAMPSIMKGEIITMELSVSDIIQLIGIVSSSIISLIAVILSLISIRQNSKALKDATRPYVVVYNDLVNGANTPIQFLIIRNFGQTAAVIESLEITPEVKVHYSDGLFKHMKNQIIAPGQSYSTAFKLDDSTIILNVSISYRSGKNVYHDSYSISQKAISDNVHSKIMVENYDHAQKIIAGCFQDYLRSRL